MEKIPFILFLVFVLVSITANFLARGNRRVLQNIIRSVFLVCFVVFFIGLFGFFGYGASVSYRQQSYAHAHYTPTQAIVTRSEVVCTTAMPSRLSGVATNSGSCTPIIEYKYNLDGQTYNNSRYAFISRNEITPSMRLKNYPLGAQVTAYVDPEDHAESLLDNSAWSGDRMMVTFLPPLLIMAIIVIAGVLIMNRLKSRFAKQTPDNF